MLNFQIRHKMTLEFLDPYAHIISQVQNISIIKEMIDCYSLEVMLLSQYSVPISCDLL